MRQLVDTFNDHRDHYRSSAYNETQLRREFLDPFFKTLGWDIDNTRGYADAYKDVIHEDAIKFGGSTKAPDYCFRIGGARKFFLEAKRPSVNIKLDVAPAYQLRRYAWSAKLPLSILSDFEELSIYDCRIRPKRSDSAAKARISYLTFDQYEDRWDEIESVFSREAVLKGSFDKYAEDNAGRRGASEVDFEFLTEIERWRSLLARGFATRNEALNVRDLNFSVQKTIDRIIFLRICEDRGSEDYGRLQKLVGVRKNYGVLMDLFQKADDRYNSGLFHFSHEKNRAEAHDTLTPSLELDDSVLDQIISHLYYPESPYEFSVLPASILGHVYEQFLGKTIRLTAGHQAKIEEKPEVRKAGGVYYTPKYIVDHMVENTVARLLNGGVSGKLKPISVTQASSIKVLDPACGSGSFLIEAYQYLLDWHRDQYTLDPSSGQIDLGKIRHHCAGRNPRLYQAPGGEYRLTTGERKRILLNNIFGVDIDAQAVEVTKLSLLLKVLEGENQQNLQRDFISEGERILPDLGRNIKCGNSIIGHDYYDQDDLPEMDFDATARINSFDWESEFPEVFGHGGFDCVLANPPYVDIKDHPTEETKYFFAKYGCANNRINLFSTFFERSLDLIKGDGGFVSMIVPTSVLAQSSYQPLREYLLQRSRLEELARFELVPEN
ncbi:MAG: N-6 DNA methylase [Alphaproteobacteria bacterium]|nr:N-6 DNA methylase [Alphaproteobacteria bacterium]